jgi:hypothetical protein
MDHQAEQADAWHENRTTNDTVRYGRRAVVGRFAAFSAAIFAAFAARSSSAFAYAFACCQLVYGPASGHWCSNSGTDFSCPSCYFKYIWSCCSGNTVWNCGECALCDIHPQGCTCWDGYNYVCSFGWNTHYACV